MIRDRNRLRPVLTLTLCALCLAPKAPSGDALVNVALDEMATLADAETLCAVDTGYYVSLENLNDISQDGFEPDHDFIGDGGGTAVIRPSHARFLDRRLDLTVGPLSWQGPYVNYQRTDDEDWFEFDIGTPLDPWGGLYYFYTPAGLVDPPMDVTLDDYGDAFDRYAIVSYGPDLLFDTSDDLFYHFGSAPAAILLTSVSPSTARVGDLLTFRGYRFGQPGGNVRILFNGTAVEDGFTTWTPTVIRRRALATDPLGEVAVSVTGGGTPTTPPLALRLLPAASPPSNAWLVW